jgi:hypothetical protein
VTEINSSESLTLPAAKTRSLQFHFATAVQSKP